MVDLTQRLEAAEEESARLSDTLEQMSAQKSALERDIAALQGENEHLRGNSDTLNQEKWELSAANADLQNRLQAVSFMQVIQSFFGFFRNFQINWFLGCARYNASGRSSQITRRAQ